MAVEYRLTITKIETDVPVTEDEYKQTGTGDDGKPTYGYVKHEVLKVVETQVLQQRLEHMDVAAVANLINQGAA